MHFMSHRFDLKSMNRAIVVELSRLPPVGSANDIETGDFELADDPTIATRQLYERLPDAQPWVIRIGYRAVRRFGARSLKDALSS
jgi:hypothetical protein